MSETIAGYEGQLLELVRKLPEEAVQRVVQYARKINEQEQEKMDEAYALRKFIEWCKSKGIDYQNLREEDDDLVLQLIVEDIHKRRTRRNAHSG